MVPERIGTSQVGKDKGQTRVYEGGLPLGPVTVTLERSLRDLRVAEPNALWWLLLLLLLRALWVMRLLRTLWVMLLQALWLMQQLLLVTTLHAAAAGPQVWTPLASSQLHAPTHIRTHAQPRQLTSGARLPDPLGRRIVAPTQLTVHNATLWQPQ